MAGYVHFYKKGAAEYGEWRVSVRDGDKVTHERRTSDALSTRKG